MKNGKALVLDIGGTKLASALAHWQGEGYELLDYRKTATPSTGRELVEKVGTLVEEYQRLHRFSRLGLAVAGQIDAAGTTVISSPNLPNLRRFPLQHLLEKRTGLAVSMRNDVRCFALGEDRFGRSRGYANALFVAAGTGVGGALKLNDHFCFGAHNIAGEFGHMVIRTEGAACGCGRRGCWESYVGGAGIEARYREMYGESLPAKEIVRLGLAGEARAARLVEELVAALAVGLGNLVNLLDPEIIVVGGSIFEEKAILARAREQVRGQVLPPARRPRIVKASLGDKAFLLGAAL